MLHAFFQCQDCFCKISVNIKRRGKTFDGCDIRVIVLIRTRFQQDSIFKQTVQICGSQ